MMAHWWPASPGRYRKCLEKTFQEIVGHISLRPFNSLERRVIKLSSSWQVKGGFFYSAEMASIMM